MSIGNHDHSMWDRSYHNGIEIIGETSWVVIPNKDFIEDTIEAYSPKLNLRVYGRSSYHLITNIREEIEKSYGKNLRYDILLRIPQEF